MSARTKRAKEEDGFIKETLQKAEQAAEDVLDIERLKKKAMNTIEDGIVDAKRLVKRGRYAAEDLVDDTTHYIKHDPWRSVGTSFGIGLSLGVVIGLLVAYKSKKA